MEATKRFLLKGVTLGINMVALPLFYLFSGMPDRCGRAAAMDKRRNLVRKA
jgi:hypothetical protein